MDSRERLLSQLPPHSKEKITAAQNAAGRFASSLGDKKSHISSTSLDYERLGFRVIWVLHDKHFNKKMLSRAEAFLRKKTCYYSNLDANGKGEIYDQFERLSHRWRRYKSKPFPIDLSHPSLMSLSLKEAPPYIEQRTRGWSLYHRGDIVDLFLSGKLSSSLLEKRRDAQTKPSLKQRYRSWLYILLEMSAGEKYRK